MIQVHGLDGLCYGLPLYLINCIHLIWYLLVSSFFQRNWNPLSIQLLFRLVDKVVTIVPGFITVLVNLQSVRGNVRKSLI